MIDFAPPRQLNRWTAANFSVTGMVKAIFIATAVFSFAQCRAKPIQPTAAGPVVTQPSNTVRSESSPPACDFSKYNPLKLGLSTGGYATSLPRPAYPPEARDQHAASQVTLRLLIDVRTGSVEQACFVSGNNLFEQSSKDAALRSKFSFAKP
ncbi:MAG TPA: hypothetical protein VGL29_14915, partial [Blastocatellia bacterium]